MAENRDRDNEGGIDATDFAADGSLRLPLGELGRKDHFGTAIANKKFILEIARMLKSFGDVEIEQIAEERKKLKRHISLKEYFSTASLTKILQTLDFALEWFEQSAKKSIDDKAGKQNSETTRPILPVDQTDTGSTVVAGDQQQDRDQYQKKESVLRGLFYVIGFGDYEYYVGLLERSCKFYDLPEDPYKAERKHIEECFNMVEENKTKVSELVKMACDLLQEIIKEPQFNRRKAAQFNSTVRQANVLIESCRDMLTEVETTMNELTSNVNTIKWSSRLLRITGLLSTWYGIYYMSPSTSTVDSPTGYVPSTGLTFLRKFALNRGLKYVGLGALCAVAGYGWLALYPSRAYAFRDDLKEIKLKHRRFCKAFHGLEKATENCKPRLY